MVQKDIRKRMSLLHEEYVAKLFGSRKNPGSGNQWAKPMDGRTDSHAQKFGFAWDCKATRAASMAISLETWSKASWQSGWERTMIPIRFYYTDRLDRFKDLVVIDLDTLHELVEEANGNGNG